MTNQKYLYFILVLVLSNIFFLTSFLLMRSSSPVPPPPSPPSPTPPPKLPSCPQCPPCQFPDCKCYCTIVKATNTTPSFNIIGPNDGVDHGGTVSVIYRHGIWAKSETSIFGAVLKDRCVEGYNGFQVFDIGANMGYFSLFSASMGCRVKAFEPQPGAFHFLDLAIQMNKFKSIYAVHAGVDNDTKGFYISKGADWSIAMQSDSGIFVKTVKLEDEINMDIILLKIDVEGFEDNVLVDFDKIIGKYEVENIICEFKYSRHVEFKREIINFMLEKYDVVNYEEKLIEDGIIPEIKDIKCEKVGVLNDPNWLKWEDVWFIRKGSVTSKRVKGLLECLNRK